MNKKIPVNIPEILDKEKNFLYDAINTNWFSSSGKYIEEFENQFSKFIGKKYGVAVSNGSAALDVAIASLNLEPGSIILVQNFTIVSPILSIIRAGLIPKLIDVDPKTFNINADLLEKELCDEVKAVLVVHIYGLCPDMQKIEEICFRNNKILIEDAAEAHGLKCRNKNIGKFGLVSTYSFFANKLITCGEGGMVVTDDKKLYLSMLELRNIGFKNNGPRYIHETFGWNYRMTNMQAALGLGQLQNIHQKIIKKQKIGNYYNDQINNKLIIKPPIKLPYCQNVFWVYGILTKDKTTTDKLKFHLEYHNIDYRTFFYPINKQPIFMKEEWTNCDLPVSSKLYDLGIYLPSGIGTSEEQLKRVSDVINCFEI